MTDRQLGKVQVAVEMSAGLMFDGCHKIYVLMDEGQVSHARELDYEVVLSAGMTPRELMGIIRGWWGTAQECGLQYVTALRSTVNGTQFVSLIPQGE